MSNTLLRLAHRVTGLPAMARQVLVVLADEARDARGGRSSLTTGDIADRTGLSRRTIHRAYVILAEAGHITREETAAGAARATLVHPQIISRLPDADLAEGPATVSAPPCQPVRGSIEYRDRPIDHSPRASAREVSFFQDEATPAPAAAPAAEPEPVAQVFAAWNAMAARCGLPGPVGRDVPREAAIDALLAREKLWRVLSAIGAVGRSPWLTGKRRDGQGDWMATFDWVFEVRRFAGSGNFNRILEGEFNRGQAVPVDPPTPAAAAPPMTPDRDEPEPTRKLRAVLRDRLGERNAATWIDPLRFEWQAEALRVIAPNAFLADWVTGHFTGHLDRAAREVAGGPISVRISVRERV